MVSIDWITVGILALNVIFYLLVTRLKDVKEIRGGAISGWLSSMPGFYFLITQNKIPLFGLEKVSLMLIYSIIAAVSILLVFVSRDDPSTYNIPVIGDLFYYLPRVGIFMGIVTAALNQIIV